VYTYIYTYYTHILRCRYIHIYVHTYICVYTYMNIYIYTHYTYSPCGCRTVMMGQHCSYIHKYTHIHTCTYIHIYVHAYICIYIYIHILYILTLRMSDSHNRKLLVQFVHPCNVHYYRYCAVLQRFVHPMCVLYIYIHMGWLQLVGSLKL